MEGESPQGRSPQPMTKEEIIKEIWNQFPDIDKKSV